MMAFYLSFAILLADVNGTTVIGKVLMRTATTNGISIRAFMADTVLPWRTDTLVLELGTAKTDGNSMALWYLPEKTFFLLDLRDSEGKPVKRTSDGDRRLLDLPRKGLEFNSQRPVPVGKMGNGFPERFNLSELYILEPGKTYTLRVHTLVKKLGEPYRALDLTDIQFKVGEIPP